MRSKYMKKYIKKIDIFVSLPTTSPLRKDIDIKKSLSFFIKNRYKYDMLVSTTKQIICLDLI